MSKHWRPKGKIVRLRPVGARKWARIDGYFKSGGPGRPGERHTLFAWLLAAVVTGLVGAAIWLRWPSDQGPAKPDSPIEWNEVQPVPRAQPRPEDQEWEKRGQEQGPNTGQTVDGQNIRVIDGDTFDINGIRVRVAGIDAPETHPPHCPQEAALGAAATQKLAQLLRSGTLWMSGEKTDRYGRSVRTVRVNGEDVADVMIGSGLARNYDGKPRQGWC
jgi:hypothetical protein